ncbi:TLP18.3, Psb32 and MOLO-1 founding protein of phosphatase [Arachidicoccus rhizosphaerae]|jgi:uncharacterized membrane protein|uniref:TLP18.3, Psb32 and MOLO-1 founding protein of phosphatase n=1 Tax=Arachidicoccus rhizosphaerae TaxID=551991 RepID=A0A1H4A7R1_9BACT|nr:TPM domain-containing protein [Arachidicoccus rhizosphaerae]SEA31701.1 TLP18.3, Psb32 and MOLO-1 founding protein of phosphatase [Arachidicoccus rhizosphaerae]
MQLFNKKKDPGYFTPEEQTDIVQAIKKAETATSGEIRLYVEGRCKYVDALDRAKEVFDELRMFETAARNGVLIYLAMKDRQLAVFGDEGIHAKVGMDFWKQKLSEVKAAFTEKSYGKGLTLMILSIGEALKKAFPYNQVDDINELPDDIVYGK